MIHSKLVWPDTGKYQEENWKELKGKDCGKKDESGDFSYIRLYKMQTMVSFLV